MHLKFKHFFGLKSFFGCFPPHYVPCKAAKRRVFLPGTPCRLDCRAKKGLPRFPGARKARSWGCYGVALIAARRRNRETASRASTAGQENKRWGPPFGTVPAFSRWEGCGGVATRKVRVYIEDREILKRCVLDTRVTFRLTNNLRFGKKPSLKRREERAPSERNVEQGASTRRQAADLFPLRTAHTPGITRFRSG